MLGVCLGHQAIGLAFGAPVVRAPTPVHGKTSAVEHDGRGIFAGVASPFEAAATTRWSCRPPRGPTISWRAPGAAAIGLVMGLRHREWPIHGVQFHPESILTGPGHQILRTFLAG